MDPAHLKRAPNLGLLPGYYSRRHNGRYVPYGHSQVHSTFYDRQRGGRWTPYGSLGHSQIHSTFYDREQAGRWTPYGGLGDFVYKPVGGGPEVMPGAEMEAYAGYGQDPPANGPTVGNVWVAGVIGFLIGQFAGEHFERALAARGTYRHRGGGGGG